MDGPNVSGEIGNHAGTTFFSGTILEIVKSTTLPTKNNLPIRMARFLDMVDKNVIAATVNLEFWQTNKRRNSEIRL